MKEYDEFEEWIDGSTKLRYSPYSREAQAHISGWAMKYTNNHNKFVLKKTCVGVLLCSKDCTLPNGLKIVVRPAISDKGKRRIRRDILIRATLDRGGLSALNATLLAV